MLKKLIHCFNIPFGSSGSVRFNYILLSEIQWNLVISTLQICKNMNNGLKQYYADLLMLELLEQGRL